MKFYLAILLFPAVLSAQTVEAPFAQYLATVTMSAHPELKKMGIHAVPPGKTDSQIIGSNVPTKLGKKSSAPDMAVVKANQPHAGTKEGVFDLAFPLNDKSGQPIGLLVMEIFSTQAKDEADALAKGAAIRDEVSRQIPTSARLFGPAPATAPLVLLSTTPLPDITGDFDHFAVDVEHDRLWVSAEVHHSIELFKLKTGEHVRSYAGVTTPHTIAYEPQTNRLLVADGGDGSCRILDGDDLHQIATVPLEPGPDAGFYDGEHHLFYIGNGGRTAKADFSYITAVNADNAKVERKIRVEANNLEEMAMEPVAKLLYVNMRDKSSVGVVDLDKGEVKQTWPVPGLQGNTPLSLDADHRRLFIAGRKPGKFLVLDTSTGKTVAALDTIETADDMTFDPTAKRIYVTGAGGVTVIEQQSADQYRTLAQFATNSGKTSVYVPQLHQFYIIHTKTAEDAAALQVYKVQ